MTPSTMATKNGNAEHRPGNRRTRAAAGASGPYAVVALAMAVAAGCAHPAVISQQPRPLTAFTALDLGPGFTGEVLAGGAFSVVIRGDTRFLPHVMTRVEHGTLVVRMSDLVAVRPDQPMSVIVRLPSVDRLVVTGSQLNVTGLAGTSMAVKATAGSRVEAQGVSGLRLALTVADRSRLRITGTVDELKADVSGASQVEARHLQAGRASVAVTPDARLELTPPLSGGAPCVTDCQS